MGSNLCKSNKEDQIPSAKQTVFDQPNIVKNEDNVGVRRRRTSKLINSVFTNNPVERKSGHRMTVVNANDQSLIESQKVEEFDLADLNVCLVEDFPKHNYENFDLIKTFEIDKMKIYRVRSKITKKTYIMKEIKLDVSNIYYQNELISYKISKKLDYPLITNIFDSFLFNKRCFFVFETSPKGYLIDLIKKGYEFTEVQVAFIGFQLIMALIYLNSNKIMHRNINPSNILIIDNNYDQNLLFIKIGDFTYSKFYEKNEKENELVGKGYYVPPEVISGHYDYRCDMWTIGVILYLLIEGEAPFIGKSKEETFNKIQNEKLVFNKSSLAAEEIISQILRKDPEKRISPKEALKNNWFKNLRVEERFFQTNLKNVHKIFDQINVIPLGIKNKFLNIISKELILNDELLNIHKTFYMLDKGNKGKIFKHDLINFYIDSGLKYDMEKIDQIFYKKRYLTFSQFRKISITFTLLLKNSEVVFYIFRHSFYIFRIMELKYIFEKHKTAEVVNKIDKMVSSLKVPTTRLVEMDIFEEIMKFMFKS